MSKEKKAGLLHASERDGVNYRKASWLQMILGNANNGCGMCFYLLMIYASYIGSQGYGILSATVGIILMATRIFDGVTDAFFAALFEKFPAKHGKIRIFIIMGWAIASLAVLIMFSWASGRFTGIAGIIVFILAYVLYIIGYTINGIAGATVSIVITNDPTQRPMNGLISTLYSYLTPMLFNNVIAFLILPKYDDQYNVPMLREACYLYVAFGLIFVVLACIGLRKVDVEETYQGIKGIGKEKKERIKFKDMIAVLKHNREAQMYIVTGVSDKFAQQVGSQSVITTLLNGILIGSYKAATMVGNVTMIVGILFAFAGGIFVAKKGAKKSTVTWSLLCIIFTAVNLGYFIFLGPNGMSAVGKMGIPIIIFAVLMVGTTASKMVLTTTGVAMRGDVVDYELSRSGNYLPAVIGGVYNFMDKIVTSVCSAIAGFCIAAIGYVNTVPQMGDKITMPLFIMSMFLSFGLPIIGWLINLVAMKFYKLDRETMISVQKDIADKKEAARAAEAANTEV